MLKKERLMSILKLVDQNEIVTVNDLVETLNVSDMTIRRDLDELSNRKTDSNSWRSAKRF